MTVRYFYVDLESYHYICKPIPDRFDAAFYRTEFEERHKILLYPYLYVYIIYDIDKCTYKKYTIPVNLESAFLQLSY